MIVVTGAAGFIGSALLGRLEKLGYGELIGVDDFSDAAQMKNLNGKNLKELVDRELFFDWFEKYGKKVQFVFHIGARTDTTEFNSELLNELNPEYSKAVWNLCIKFSVPLIYASSAATYGNGDEGFEDNEDELGKLQPLNPYGWSKQQFDLWMHEQKEQPPFWAGFKFFNVFGPNEWHKGRMASVVLHSFNQINQTGKVKLFKSHKAEYKDGMQLRDFIYVQDLLNVLIYFMENRKYSGLYNLGTGKARSFMDLALAVFAAMRKEPEIEYIDIPEDIREKYQYFTKAGMQKAIDAGYKNGFMELEDSVNEYVNEYLKTGKYY